MICTRTGDGVIFSREEPVEGGDVPPFYSSLTVFRAQLSLWSSVPWTAVLSSRLGLAFSPPAASAARSHPPLSADAPARADAHCSHSGARSQCLSCWCRERARRTSCPSHTRTSSVSPPSSCCGLRRQAGLGEHRLREPAAGPGPGRWVWTRPSRRSWSVRRVVSLVLDSSWARAPQTRLQKTESPEWRRAAWDSPGGQRNHVHLLDWAIHTDFSSRK